MNIPSDLIQQAVQELSSLPGIGKKTALRMALQLLKRDRAAVQRFGNSIIDMRNNIKYCSACHNIADDELCNICDNPSRDETILCVVETIRDVFAIENTSTFRGKYHVLSGVISPIDGVGPEQLNITSLLERISNNNVNEVIMALNPTMEGDTTIFYISKQLPEHVKLSTISRGISFGGELEYTDELTLSRSIAARIPFDNAISDQK